MMRQGAEEKSVRKRGEEEQKQAACAEHMHEAWAAGRDKEESESAKARGGTAREKERPRTINARAGGRRADSGNKTQALNVVHNCAGVRREIV